MPSLQDSLHLFCDLIAAKSMDIVRDNFEGVRVSIVKSGESNGKSLCKLAKEKSITFLRF